MARRTAARRVFTSSLVKMCLVCVRSVFTETNSRRAISGPLSSVASRRSTSISRSLSPSSAARSGGAGAGGLLCGGQQVLGVRPDVRRRGACDLPEQVRHRLSLVEEQPAVAGRHPGGEGGGEVGHRRVRVAVRVVGERPHQARLDQAAVAARGLRGVHHAVEQVERLRARCPRRRAAGRG